MITSFPYPGLRPFHRDETDIFFGREEQVDQLLGKLGDSHFLPVIGPSGCGKSSLVRAGLIPALETGFMASAGARWRIADMRPGNHPLRNLAEALVAESALGHERGGEADSAAFLHAALRRGPLGLVEVLRETPLPKRTNLLLLVDQFEEIFRYREEGSSDEADAFVSLLLATAEEREVPVYVVMTMRSDFLGNCTVFHGLPEAINESQFLTPRLTRQQQHDAIAYPARMFDGDVESALINRLLNDMGPDPDQLPLMQHVLMRMWTRASEALALHESESQDAASGPNVEAITLTLADYEELGGLTDALSKHADEAFEELDEEQQRIAEVMFRLLTGRSADQRDTRRPTPLEAVAKVAGASHEQVETVVEVFRQQGRNFITPPVGTSLSPDTILDISHESLIRQWETLNDWVKQEAESVERYRFLEQTARFWKDDAAALWGTPDLDIALDWKKRENPTPPWAQRYGVDFELAMEFLDASEKQREEERRQKEAAVERERQAEAERQQAEIERQQAEIDVSVRDARRLRQFLAALAGISLFAVGFAVFAFVQRQGAVQAKKAELAARQIAEKDRDKAEQAKAEALVAQQTAEKRRIEAEEAKEQALTAQQTAEKRRIEAEKAKKEAEAARRTAEEDREKAEQAKAEALAAQQTAEERRIEAEEAKVEALAAQQTAEERRIEAEEAKEQAWEAKQMAEEAKERALAAQQIAEEHRKKTVAVTEEAERTYRDLLDQTIKTKGEKRNRAGVENDLGESLRKTGKYLEALNHFREALKIYGEIGDETAKQRVKQNIETTLEIRSKIIPPISNESRARFKFTCSTGKKIPCYRTHSLDTPNSELQRAIIVIHGVNRNADSYFSHTVRAARTENRLAETLIVAPQFQTREDDPGSGEHFWSGGWSAGDKSQDNKRISSFAVLDEIYDKICQNFSEIRTIVLIGHSSGALFVNRYIAGGKGPSRQGVSDLYVVMNPSSYLYIDKRRPVPGQPGQFEVPADASTACPQYNDYKYGLSRLNTYMREVGADKMRTNLFRRKAFYLAGDRDIHKRFLDTRCQANYQGAHRFERAQNYRDYIALFPEWDSVSTFEIVSGVGHSPGTMINSAIARKILFDLE